MANKWDKIKEKLKAKIKISGTGGFKPTSRFFIKRVME